jgi:hypothetical protein
MSLEIKIDIPQASRAIIAKLQSFKPELGEAIKRGMDKGSAIVLGKTLSERFRGQGPFPVAEHRLGIRTHRLWDSLRWTKAQSVAVGGKLVEVSASMGSNIEYFGVHEFGFEGDVQVKSFSRKVSELRFGRAPVKGKKKTVKKKETVRAHVRHLRIPARAPLRHGIEDHIGEFTEQIGIELETL